MGTRRAHIADVVVGDDPAAWTAAGFAVRDGGVCRIGTVDVHLVGADDDRGRGVLGWTLALRADRLGHEGADVPHDLDGLPTRLVDVDRDGVDGVDAGWTAHPNGARVIDHVVVVTPDLDRTTAAFGALGVEARRTREAGPGRLQRFFRLGEVVLELVGPAAPAGTGPASFFGLALTVDDLDATAALLDGRIGAPKPAVQPGRRIATVRGGDDVSVALALMSAPEPAAPRGASGASR